MTRHPNGVVKSQSNAFDLTALTPTKRDGRSDRTTPGKPLPLFGKALVLDCAGRRTVPLNPDVLTTSIAEAA
jgi:hypothetical protein